LPNNSESYSSFLRFDGGAAISLANARSTEVVHCEEVLRLKFLLQKLLFYVLALQKVSGAWRQTPGRPKLLKLAWLNKAVFSMSFNYVLPTTGAVSFTFFISSPPARLHGALAETGAQRGRLRDILKRLKRADDKDTLAVIKVLV